MSEQKPSTIALVLVTIGIALMSWFIVLLILNILIDFLIISELYSIAYGTENFTVTWLPLLILLFTIPLYIELEQSYKEEDKEDE